jgi:hypothetical protein
MAHVLLELTAPLRLGVVHELRAPHVAMLLLVVLVQEGLAFALDERRLQLGAERRPGPCHLQVFNRTCEYHSTFSAECEMRST